MSSDIHTHTDRYIYPETHRHDAYTHRYIHTHRYTQTDIYTQIDTHRQTQIHRYTCRGTHTDRHKHTHTPQLQSDVHTLTRGAQNRK